MAREKLLKDLDELKQKATIPNLFLANYFIRLRNDVDKEIAPKQLILKNDDQKKNELNELWQKFIAKIDSFEKKCLRKRFNLEVNIERLNAIETMLKSKEAVYNLKEAEEEISNEEINLMKNLFQNKTIFLTKADDKKIITNVKLVLLNDEFISEQSVTER